MEFTGERFVPTLKGEIKYEHLHRYALSMLLAKGKTVLDLASGEGYGSAILAKIAESVVGVDIDPESVTYAKNQYINCDNLKFLVGSCASIPLPNHSIDLVTSFETIEHHNQHEEMMQEIKRVLKENGTLIISSPNRLTYSDEPNYSNPYHIKELYYDELVNLLNRYFRYVKIYGQRLATGSFIFPLENPQQDKYNAFTGNIEDLIQKVSCLESPIYFVAICSDQEQQLQLPLDSVYIDAADDLLKVLQNSWQKVQVKLEQSQAQLRQTQTELEQSQAQLQQTQTELTQTQAQLQQTQTELEQSQAQLQQTQTELTQTQAQLQQTQTELEHSQTQLQQTQTKLEHSQAQLQHTQTKLEHSQAQLLQQTQAQLLQQTQAQLLQQTQTQLLQQTQTKLEQTQTQLQQTQTQLEQTQTQLQCTRTELANSPSYIQELNTQLQQTQIQLQQTQVELENSQNLMVAMMSSKFWQLRTVWLKLKQMFGSGGKDAATDWLVQYISKSKRIAQESLRAAQEIKLSQSDQSAREIKLYIDYVFYIPKVGIYLQGWIVDPMSKVKNLNLVTTDGNTFDLDKHLQRKKRADIFTQFQQMLYKLSTDELGIYGCVPIDTELTQFSQLTIEANLKSGQTLKFNIELMEIPNQPLPIIQDILSIEPLPRHKLRYIFDNHVGPTIRYLWQNRHREITENIVREYGKQPSQPEVSIIVPLYGRIDFIKYQLAIFANDADFRNNELIYVLDDPRMYDEFLHLCELLAPLFQVPFKTLYMGTNLGYAGANNAAVSISQGKVLVLMNSDVMPSHSGWVSKLLSLYDSLEQVGAIGAKLLYEDGSIQHAGMAFSPHPPWDNLLINDHPKKGQANLVQLNPQPQEVPAVTGACLMISRQLYDEVNGLDEEYIIGNFEDSDLCLKLHTKGYKNYYIPGVELFHFESQSIKSNSKQQSWYQGHTLYNCWLHNLRWESYILNNKFLRPSKMK
jgi:GT2 family glycosyltransferase/ubiquinone/menaquinone biosynthesis C-methylase UbiE